MSIVAFLTIWPSAPLTSPSIAVICAHEAPVERKKDKANNLYPRDFASMLKPPQDLISNFKHTTTPLGGSTAIRPLIESILALRTEAPRGAPSWLCRAGCEAAAFRVIE